MPDLSCNPPLRASSRFVAAAAQLVILALAPLAASVALPSLSPAFFLPLHLYISHRYCFSKSQRTNIGLSPRSYLRVPTPNPRRCSNLFFCCFSRTPQNQPCPFSPVDLTCLLWPTSHSHCSSLPHYFPYRSPARASHSSKLNHT